MGLTSLVSGMTEFAANLYPLKTEEELVALLSGMHHFPPGVPERSWSPRSWSSSSRQSATRASSSRRCTRATAPSSTRRLRLPPPPLRRRARRHTLSGRRAAARSGWIRTARRSWITCQAALQLVGREGLRSEVGERPSAAPHCSSRARPPARAARRRGEAGGSSAAVSYRDRPWMSGGGSMSHP